MATTKQHHVEASADEPSRTNKTSAIRSFIHKRTLSKGAALGQRPVFDLAESPTDLSATAFLPPDHPASQPLSEVRYGQQNKMPSSPTKSKDGDGLGLKHKKSFSTLSLKGLAESRKSPSKGDKEGRPASPKKTKSSTNLAALLSRPKSSKNLKKKAMEEEEARQSLNKENRAPDDVETLSRPPIYAQFSSEYFNKQPLGGKFLEDQIDLYTPQPYTPNQQRNFVGSFNEQPKLFPDASRRPKSTALPAQYSVQDISRQNSSARKSSEEQRPQLHGVPDWNSPSKRHTYQPSSAPSEQKMSSSAVPSFGSKNSRVNMEDAMDIKEVDAALEDLLDRRNIPEDQRHKMRNVALAVKMSLIRHDQEETGSRPSTTGSVNLTPEINKEEVEPEQKKRPRSRTFTLSRASKESTSPTKKNKGDATPLKGHVRSKSSDSGSVHSTESASSLANSLVAKAKGQTPKDFVNYLQKVQRPELVEVGRVQKLRQLLRNEKIGWTDEFVNLGGMKEIISLLHRIMEVEWREEHEDTLLHNTLLCLKALCTTTLAQTYLATIQNTLFPALIHLIFDEEHKGPADFTTRNIITSLLFTYIKCAPIQERGTRAKTVLSYLRDPQKEEDERPVGFVLEMHRERPYRVWCKEVVNVTKEVFWIFLHNLNVIALPKYNNTTSTTPSNQSSTDSTSEPPTPQLQTYLQTHFPTEAPPVPAAPYVGSVEWDATNYLTSHLDLLNSILASLPTLSERNMLRDQLRISGWERIMGGTLRLCKEKFYGGVHAALRCWVAAALEDGWEVTDVRCGPKMDASPKRIGGGGGGKNGKKAGVDAPRIEMPKLDFGNADVARGDGAVKKSEYGDVWL